MSLLTPGTPAPDFSLPVNTGETFCLSEHKGKTVVLFFYPKDNTPGCTIENQEFSALSEKFAALGTVLLGISPDSFDSHCGFADKYGLKMPLASDEDHKVIDAFGAWQLKKTFGKEYMGVVRSTFIVGPDGKIVESYKVSKVKGHAEQVLEKLTQKQG